MEEEWVIMVVVVGNKQKIAVKFALEERWAGEVWDAQAQTAWWNFGAGNSVGTGSPAAKAAAAQTLKTIE